MHKLIRPLFIFSIAVILIYDVFLLYRTYQMSVTLNSKDFTFFCTEIAERQEAQCKYIDLVGGDMSTKIRMMEYTDFGTN